MTVISADALPLPPEELSIRAYTERRWDEILELWKRGWHAESSVESLETYLEFHRKRIFEDQDVDGIYDWRRDWVAATMLHDRNSDFVRNRRAYNEDLKRMWFEWHERTVADISKLSMEALRGMIVVNGAAILASLTLLSGQISRPNPSAVLAAKIMVFCSILSLVMMAGGHLLIFMRVIEMTGRVRGVLVGHTRHRKLYAVSRFLKKHMDPIVDKANALIYGSIFVFSFSALVAACILVFGSAP